MEDLLAFCAFGLGSVSVVSPPNPTPVLPSPMPPIDMIDVSNMNVCGMVNPAAAFCYEETMSENAKVIMGVFLLRM